MKRIALFTVLWMLTATAPAAAIGIEPPVYELCTYTIDPAGRWFPYEGGSGSVDIAAPDGCSWAAKSDKLWIVITSQDYGDGSGTVFYQVEANQSQGERQGSISIADQELVVKQEGVQPVYHTLTAQAGDGGSIEPSGDVEVAHGDNVTFEIFPDEGHETADVLVDGSSQGPQSTFTFYDVSSDHTLQAFFEPFYYIVEAQAGEGGSIDPSGEVEVPHGEAVTFYIFSDEGFEIADLLIDGSSQGPQSTFTFYDVSSDHTIQAFFEPVYGDIDPDAQEGDSGNDSPFTAWVIVPDGEPLRSNFHAAGDEDWFKFYGIEGETYTVAAFELGDRSDPLIQVFDSELMNLLEQSGRGLELVRESLANRPFPRQADADEVRFDFVPPKDDVYMLRVTNGAPDVFGQGTEYDLSVTTRWASTVTAVLKGVVLDAATGEPLGDVLIRSSHNCTGISLPSGDYVMPHPAGIFTVATEAPGYQAFTDTVHIQEGQTVVRDIRLLCRSGAAESCELGGAAMGAVVQGGIDIGECPLFRLHLGCQPPLDGFGRLYVSLQTPSVPALTGYVFFRPGNAPLSNGSYIRLAGDAGGFFEDAADYSYSRGPLNHAQPDLVFDIGTAGLSGFTVIFETLYLEDGGPASMARAERLQQVTVDFR